MQHDLASATIANAETEDLLTEMKGSLAIVTLNRPRALNAMTIAMRRKLADFYPRCAREPMNYAVCIRSSSEKAFCSGADVREVIALARQDRAMARAAFVEEYSLNWLHECFSKPTISLINGAVMGGGVGISLYGTHRVGGEQYKFAMPETAIGLFPDVGVAHVLARMPGAIGVYLGLTGRTVGRADAYRLGLLTHCIPAEKFAEIQSALIDTWPVDTVLDNLHADPGPGELPAIAGAIERCFSAPTVEEIVARLGAEKGSAREWAQTVLAELAVRSPLALKVTLRHIRDSAALDLRQTLEADYRLVCRFLEGDDFYEGVRAALIDKDRAPKWRPARLEDVTLAMVDEYFATLGSGELNLPSRRDMQAARV